MKRKNRSFKNKVLAIVAKIPRGKVLTYKEVAALAGNPRAYRAVGNIMAGNPDPKHIPCHRVIRSDGGPGGYSMAGGSKRKLRILRKEGAQI